MTSTQNLINQTINDIDKPEKREWKVAGYAPSRLPKDNNAEHKKLQNLRRALYANKAQTTEKLSNDLKRDANVKANEAQQIRQAKQIAEAAKKQHNRIYFLDRISNKKVVSNSYLSHDVSATLNVRITTWNKNHHCPHNYKFNKIWKTKEKFEIGCNHDVAKLVNSEIIPCNHCGCKLTKMYKTPCSCEYALCMRCKTSTFLYDYTDTTDGRIVNYFQHFDKHSANEEVFYIEPLPQRNEDRNLVDMTPRIETPIVLKIANKKQSKVSRTNFLKSLTSKPEAISFAKVTSGKFKEFNTSAGGAVSSFEECALEIQKEVLAKPVKPAPAVVTPKSKYGLDDFVEFEDSTPEGGKVTKEVKDEPPKDKKTTLGETKNILSRAKDAMLEAKDKYIQKAIINKIVDTQIYKDIMKFFETTLYVIRVIADYVDVTNILLLFDIYKSYSKGTSFSSIVGSLRAIHLLSVLKQNEEDSLNRFIGLDARAHLLKHRCNATFLFSQSFGCLTTVIRNHILETGYVVQGKGDKSHEYTYGKNTNLNLQSLKECMIINKIFNNAYDVEALKRDDQVLGEYFDSFAESGAAIMQMIANFCSHLPTSFGVGISMFSGFCKILLPILSVTKTSIDLSKLCNQAIDKFMEWWSGSFKDSKKWLTHKMASPGNPVNDLQVAYMACRAKVNCGSLIDASMNDLRANYYSLRIKAEEYATEEKQFSAAFTSFLKSHENGMQELGNPEERPFEPTCVAFMGAPGYGKSTIWPILLAGPMGLEMEKESSKMVRNTTHTWDMASEFQTGMSNKRVVLFDDFGQDKTKNVEALSLIGMVSAAQCHVNSAYISGSEIKGSSCNPEHIVICTNDANVGTSLIYSQEAVKRRIDITFEMTRRLDLNKLNEPFLNIVACTPYPKLVGGCVSLASAVAIYGMIDYRKKTQLRTLSTKLSDTTSKIMDYIMHNPDVTINPAKDVKQLDVGDTFTADMKDYLSIMKNKGISDDLMRDFAKDNKFKNENSKPEAGGQIEYIYNLLKSSFSITVGVGSSLIVISAWNEVAKTFMQDVTALKISRKFLRHAMSAVVVTVGVVGVYNLYTMYTEDNAESGTARTAKAASRPLTSRPECGEVFSNLASRSTGTIQRPDGTTVNCIFIGSHYILTVQHFFLHSSTLKLIDEGTSVKITKSSWNKGTKSFSFKHSSLIPLGGTNIVNNLEVRQDVVIYKLDGKVFSAEKNIVNHFWNAEYCLNNYEVTKFDFLSSALHVTANGDDVHLQSVGVVDSDRIYTSRKNGLNTYYHVAAKASYQARVASCGSLIVANHTQEHPLLGVHIASTSTGSSLFHFVTRDEINEALAQHEKMDLQESGVVYAQNNCPILPNESILEFVGYVTPTHQNSKTDLVPSTIYNMFEESKVEPAPLSPYDPRLEERSDYEYVKKNFYKILFEGYQQNPTFTESDLREAADYIILKNRAMKKSSIVPQRPLTLHECINGIKFMPANTRIEMTTSTGYPYTIKGIRRTDLFFEEDGDLQPTPRIVADFNDFLKNIKSGIVPLTPYTLTIKDEKIKKSKIYDQLKPRLFSNGNIISLLIQRKFFFSHIMAHYHAKETYSAVKLDRLSLDWHELIMYLQEGGNYGFDADFKFWDRSIGKILVYLADEIAFSYIKKHIVNEIGELGYNTLLEWDSSPYYVSGKKLYRGMGTIPSGKLPTFISNCDINEMLHISAYLAIMRRQNPMLGNVKAYADNNRGKRGGDDTIQSVSDLIKDTFNGVSFSEWINSHGMTCTSADKSDKIVPYKLIKDLSFLKNTTGYLSGYYVPNPDRQSIVEMMYWVRINKNNKDIHKATADNINSALRNYYFYGPDLYNKIRDSILEKFPSYVLNTYAENNLLWEEYKYFPGSHSDYSTRIDQGIDPTIDGVKKYNITPIEGLTQNMDHKFYLSPQENDFIVVSFPEAGEDKASKGLAENPSPSMPDMTNFDTLDTSVEEIMNEQQNKARSEQLGTTIQESENPLSGTVLTAGKPHTSRNKRAEATLNDKNWTLERLEKKYTLIDQIPWLISNVQNTQMVSLNIPNDILKTPAQKSPFDITAFWRAKAVNMRVIVKASAFYSGTLVVGFYPSMQTLDSPSVNQIIDMTTVIQLGGQILQLSDNQQVEFSIPFRHYFGFTEAPVDCLGQFVVYVLNPLRTGAQNDNNVLISIYCAIEDSEFKVPEFLETANYRSAKFINSRPESGDTQITCTGQVNVNDPIDKMKPVMLCAGVGLIGKLDIHQFQDHPTDMVLLRKRYTFLYRTEPAEIGPNTYGITEFNGRDLLSKIVGDLQYIFVLYRGSINIKIIQYITLKEPISFRDNVSTKVFMVPLIVNGQSLTEETINGRYNGGYSMMSHTDPAELNLPYNSAVFTSTYNFESKNAFSIEHKDLVIEAYNANNENVYISYEIHGCVGDDFATGVFAGIPSEIMPKALRFENSIPESGVVNTEDGPHLVVKCSTVTKTVDIETIEERLSNGKRVSPAQCKRYAIYLYYVKTSNWTDLQYENARVYDVASVLDDIRYVMLTEEILSPRYLKLKAECEFYANTVDSTPESGILEFIDKAIATTVPIQELVDSFGTLLDAHPVTVQPPPMRIKKQGFTVSCDNAQYMERMCVTNHNGMNLSDKETFGSTQKETNMYDLMTKVKTFVEYHTWNTSQVVGSKIATIPVGPRPETYYKTVAPVDYFGTQFEWYSGSMIYIIDVAASALHKGQLTVSFHPNLTMDNPPSSLQLATQQYFTTFDLEAGRATVAIQVPFLQKRSYLPVDAINPDKFEKNEHYNGIIVLWVQNALRGASSVDSTVDINIYKMAGQDFKYDVYGTNLTLPIQKAK